ncbi:MAG TPA: OmpA family protein [Nitrospiraceae bacterium]|jgi:peptidoglycan-associated lipoprotein
MIGSPLKTAVVAAMGLVLLVGQGCSMKWLQSDGETGTGSAQRDGSGGALSGFSKNPSEERLAKSGDIASISSSGISARQRAEITKEEKAAIEAGLQDVFFGYDQWTLSDAGMEALNHDARWLKEHPRALMKVEGHADERGTADYNLVLGEKRAKAARSYLIESGVGPKQLAVVSYGKARPFCTDPSESCYQQNRRGHVLLNVKK